METVLAFVGAIALAVTVLRVLHFVWRYVLSPSASLSAYRGQWAVVTGASSGIGAALACELAGKGVNVVLVARSVERLSKVASACSDAGVEVLVKTFDFSTTDSSAWKTLEEELRELAPRVLVNNVGINTPFPTPYIDIPASDVQRMLDINIGAADRLTRALLPAMRAARSGLVLFLSSSAGVAAPAPLLAPYAGTKAYLDAFALALAGEVARDGVIVHSVAPFFVESPMAKMRASLTVPSAELFARRTLAAVGGSPRLCPHWPHAIMADALRLLPLKTQVRYVADLHVNIRKRALRKQARIASANKDKQN